jgi:signal transduction histidine kinase
MGDRVRPVPRGMGSKLWLAFSAAALPILLLAGGLLEFQARRALENELASRVTSIAVSISSSIPNDTWRFLFSLLPGEEESRTASVLRTRLEKIATDVEAERIAVWRPDGSVYLDTAVRLPIGDPAPRISLLATEIETIRTLQTAHTPLFRSESGRLVMIGLAPILELTADAGDPLLGLIVVEIPSTSLAAISDMRRSLIMSLFGALLLVLLVALFLARGLTGRISILVSAAQRIERGDLEAGIPALGGDELGLLAGVFDKMRQAVQVREKQLRAMVGGVAHEIRNPLGGLTLYAEMLSRDQELNEKQKGKANRILAEAKRLERVVSDFLIFARPESPRSETVSLKPVIEESLHHARARTRWKGQLEVDLSNQTILCDSDHLRQICLNLLLNAMQAAGDEGSIAVTTQLQDQHLILCIEDSGDGIEEEKLEEVFQPFYSGKADGAGLGLAITKRLCDLGGILLSVDRGKWNGARFTLECQRTSD